MTVGTAGEVGSYEEACTQHRWEVPRRYNIAADVCDRQPADKTAMVFEDFRGTERTVSWAEQRSLANRAAATCAAARRLIDGLFPRRRCSRASRPGDHSSRTA